MNAAPRRPLVAGNWKMHKTVGEALALIDELLGIDLPHDVDVVVAPPFTALSAARGALCGSRIGLAAQTMNEADHGAFTGEISAPMLLELDVRWVILGHSERRMYCGESDDAVNLKVRAALRHGLTPIVAVGENQIEHAASETLGKVIFQARAAFAGLSAADVAKCVVAYEPIWAIGTGLVDNPESANAVVAEIRRSIAGLENARLLYGGSMKGDNAPALMAQPDIDGGLIGGASLSATAFSAVIEAARPRTTAG